MLPFSQERLKIDGIDVFYYNRYCLIPEIYLYSRQLHEDLSSYLGIEFELNQILKFSSAVDDERKPGEYSIQKIQRITTLYDFYIDTILNTTQLLYYEVFDNSDLYKFCSSISTALQSKFVPNEEAKNPQYHDATQVQKNELMKQTGETRKESKSFMVYFNAKIKKSGRRLSDFFKQIMKKCQPFRTMIEQQINLEFPIQTLQDQVVQKEKIVFSKKKNTK